MACCGWPGGWRGRAKARLPPSHICEGGPGGLGAACWAVGCWPCWRWRCRAQRPPSADETAAYRAELAKVIGADAVAHAVHSDADLDVYAVPAPVTPVPYLSLGTGWERREATPQESHRWMKNEATLRL